MSGVRWIARLTAGLLAGAAGAQLAAICAPGGQFDKPFNQAACKGVERGVHPVVAIGFPQARSIETVARPFPMPQFAIIDRVVSLPNVQRFAYRECGAILLGCVMDAPVNVARDEHNARVVTPETKAGTLAGPRSSQAA